LTRAIRLWFCLAVAVISAAIADPAVEFASNRGFFGRGSFTDHSNLDVVPALVVGVIFALLHVALRVRSRLADPETPALDLLAESGKALASGPGRLLPLTFAIQIAALFSMETAEQFAVFGHGLGGTIWLGGPVAVSLAAHAAACTVIAFALTRAVRACSQAAERVVRYIRGFSSESPRGTGRPVSRRGASVAVAFSQRAFCNAGGRAPPLPVA
jgi:hypothetical protein